MSQSVWTILKTNFKTSLLILAVTVLAASSAPIQGMGVAASTAKTKAVLLVKSIDKAVKKSIDNDEFKLFMRDLTNGLVGPEGKYFDALDNAKSLYWQLLMTRPVLAGAVVTETKVTAAAKPASSAPLLPAKPATVTTATTGFKLLSTAAKRADQQQVIRLQVAQQIALWAQKGKLAQEDRQAAQKLLQADLVGMTRKLSTELQASSKWRLAERELVLVTRASVACPVYYYKLHGMRYGLGLTELPMAPVRQYRFNVQSADQRFSNVKYTVLEDQTALLDLSLLRVDLVTRPAAETEQILTVTLRQLEAHAKRRDLRTLQLFVPAGADTEFSCLARLGYQVVDSIVNAGDLQVQGYIVQKELPVDLSPFDEAI